MPEPIQSIDEIPSGKDFLADVTVALGSLATLAAQASIYAQTALGLLLINAHRIPQLIESANNYVTLASASVILTARLGEMARNLLATRQEYPAGPGPRGLKIGRVPGQNLSDSSKYLDDYNLASGGKGVGIQTKSTSATELQQVVQVARTAAQDLQGRSGQFTVTLEGTGQKQLVDADNMPYRGLLLVLTEEQKSFTPGQLNALLEKVVAETGVIIETVEADGFTGPD